MHEVMTIQELIATLKAIDANPAMSEYSCRRAANSWSGRMSLTQAIHCTEFGWMEAPSVHSVTIPDSAGLIPDTDYNYEVTGEILDIASYLTGVPEHWLQSTPVERPMGNVIRLAVEIGGLHNVTAQQLENRGQAIIALIHSLELAGYSIELNIVRAFTSGRSGLMYRVLIPVKAAGEALDMMRLQFMIGNAAFYRKCLFGLTEHLQGSMGKQDTWTAEYQPAGFIHIGHTQGLCDYLDDSLAWARLFAEELSAGEILPAA
jgi:hypothetical protein